MLEIQAPFSIKGIPLKPEMKGRLKVDETLIQSLAAIMGYDGEARRLITCSLRGSLHTVSPVAVAIINGASTGATEDVNFANIPTTEIMIMANAANVGDIWANLGAVAAIDTGWPLDAGDMVKFTINNMQELNLHIITSGDKFIIIRAG